MTEYDPVQRAILAATLFDGQAGERVWSVNADAVIKLAEGTGHLLDGATITAWQRP